MMPTNPFRTILALAAFALFAFVSAANAQSFVFDSSFGNQGSAPGVPYGPDGIVVDPQGNIYFSDYNNNRIVELDSKGVTIRNIAVYNYGNPLQLDSPEGIALDANGAIYVADSSHSRIEIFDHNGVFLRQVGNRLLFGPDGIALDNNSNIYTVDAGNGRVIEFDNNGNFIRTIGSKGFGTGQLAQPSGIVLDSSGNIYVTSISNSNVTKYNRPLA